MTATQVLVIGAGPGGYVAAIRLAQSGRKVLLVDKDKVGGECLNYGCIPSKALIQAANLFHKVKKAEQWGLETDGLRLNWPQLQLWRAGLVANLGRGIAGLLKGNGVSLITGEAVFTGANQAQIKTTQGVEEVGFEQAIIATGSKPMEIPPFKIDGRLIIGSKEALELDAVPQSLLVIGGGAIGLEIGTVYAKLGVQVTVVELMNQLLPGFDLDLVAPVARNLEILGVKIYVGAQALGFEERQGAAAVKLKTPAGDLEVTVEKILLSAGRRPNSQNLGLEAIGVATDSKGFIQVNEQRETTVPGIYAIGDVTTGPLLAHRSSFEGLLVAHRISSSPNLLISSSPFIPGAIFTDPEIAFVGITEREAAARGLLASIGRFPFAASGRAATGGQTDGLVKVIAEKETGKILGVGISGPHASDLISEASLAVRMGLSAQDIAATIHPHPTYPEAFLEACEAALGQAIHILPPRRPQQIPL